MKFSEQDLVVKIAKFTPWLSPLPSGFFVARSVINHLNVPIIIAIIIGIVIESLGVTSIYCFLWLSDWNIKKRKTDPQAPAYLALILCGVYLVATTMLSVVLEVMPSFSTLSVAIFPILGLVGGFNLALFSIQNHREITVQNERELAKVDRQARHSNVTTIDKKKVPILPISNKLLDIANAVRQSTKAALLDDLVNMIYENPGRLGVTEIAKKLGRSRTTIYTYLDELLQTGRITSDQLTITSETK